MVPTSQWSCARQFCASGMLTVFSAFFNNITYKSPKVPTLYTARSAGQLAANPEVYGTYTHSFVLEKDEIVDVVINNLDKGRHPFHLHGHAFQLIYRSDEAGVYYEDSNFTAADFYPTPMRRDTVLVEANAFLIFRFKADHAGVWIMHCHIEFHMTSGLMMTFITDPLSLQNITIPDDHLDACKKAGVSTTGNAAANQLDYLNLDGQPEPPQPLPAG